MGNAKFSAGYYSGNDPANATYLVDQNGNILGTASTQDNQAAQNVGLQTVGLWNGSSIDRLRGAGALGDNFTVGLIGSVQFLFNGGSYDRERTPTRFVTIAAVNITAGTPVPVWSITGGKKFHLMGYCITSSVASSIIFKDGTTEIFRVPCLAGAPVPSPANFMNGYASSTANNALNLDVTATGVVSGFVFGTEEF